MATLADLTLRAKEESDNVNADFVAAAEWTRYINGSYGELYGLLAQKFGADYFVATPVSITTDGINQLFPLAADFFKLLSVEVQVATPTQWVTLKTFPWTDKNSISQFNTQIPAAGQTVRYWYIPRVTPLVNTTDAIADAVTINGWEEYVIVDAAMKALAKEESDVSVLMARKRQLVERIESEAANRDAGQPSRIVDVFGKRARSMQYRLNGSSLMLVGGATPGWYYGQGDWGLNDADSEFY